MATDREKLEHFGCKMKNNEKYGWHTNYPAVFAKELKMAPKAIAEGLVSELRLKNTVFRPPALLVIVEGGG